MKKTVILALFLWLFSISCTAIGKTPVGVVDIKSNVYKEYTRIVFHLNGRTSYKLFPDLQHKKIAIEINDSVLKLSGPSPHLKNTFVKALALKEKPSGSVYAEVKLRSSRVEITHFLYRDPPGIVINIRKDKEPEGKSPGIKEKVKNSVKKQRVSQTKEKRVTEEKKGRVASKKENSSAKQGLKKKTEATHSGQGLKKKTKISNSQKDTKRENTVSSSKKGPNSAIEFPDPKEPINTEQKQTDMKRERLSEGAKGAMDLFLAGSNLYREKKYIEALEKLESLLELFPRCKYVEDASFLIGDCYFHTASTDQSGRYNSAIDAYRSALRRYPDSERASWAAFQVGESYWKMNILHEAEAGYRRVVDQYPKCEYAPQAQLRIAESAAINHDYTEARKEFKRVLTRYPHSDLMKTAEFGIADNCAKLRDFKSALEYYQKAVKKWPEYPKTRPETLFHMGDTYFQNKKYEKAIHTFLKLINIFPRYEFRGRVLSRVGDALYKQGEVKTALKFYWEAIPQSSDDEDSWRTRLKMADIGVAKLSLSVLQEKIFDYGPYMNPLNTYEEISKRFTGSRLGNIALLKEGLFHLKHDRPIEAIPRFKRLLQDSPNSPLSQSARLHLQDACAKAIDVYYKEDKFLSVIKNYLESFDPSIKDIADAETLLQVGLSYEKLGLNDKARKVYERVLKGKQKGDYGDLMVFKIGKLYVSDRECDNAEKILGGFANRFPNSRYLVDVLHLIGDIRYKKGELQKAADAYLSALQGRKGHSREPEMYYFLGNSFEKLGHHNEAIKAYKNVIRSSGLHADKKKALNDLVMESRVKIGDSYYNRKRYSEALNAYIEAKRHLKKDDRALWVSFQIAECYRNIAKENEALQTLKELLNESDDGFWKKVAVQAIDNMNWEKRIKGLLY